MLRAALAAVVLAVIALPAVAANADHPYQNVDKRNDSGNDTGNSKVEGLNRAQLDENQPTHPPATAPAVGAQGPTGPQQSASPASAPASNDTR